MIIREYTMGDLKQMIMIWNEIVDEGTFNFPNTTVFLFNVCSPLSAAISFIIAYQQKEKKSGFAEVGD